MPLHDAALGLGANLGDRRAQLQRAVDLLAATPGIEVAAASPLYETAAHTWTPGDEQPAYYNAALHVRTALAPAVLLERCLAIERAVGRHRAAGVRWAPRPLDLDVLLYDDLVVDRPGLTLPHPRLAERRFVLRPLADLMPARRVPGPVEATVAELLARCPDPGPAVPLPEALTLP